MTTWLRWALKNKFIKTNYMESKYTHRLLDETIPCEIIDQTDCNIWLPI